MYKNVKIRFNTNYGKLPDQKKWRVLIDGEQIFSEQVEIHCPCKTSEDIVVGDDGKDVVKFHITCEANVFYYLKNDVLSDENDFDKIVISKVSTL
jgi:hypothetical protein